ncbi:YqgE/AlgH family protein [Sphingomonas sp. AP4-R1]|uniref:YqgE/AlgH family protein n=1 Tax=Sphingomonas sp. AP4-R1 TaxID=2735134 RepID=UPI001493DBE2|nr:YqgE/AlgH family protein [Sphingomonas sp. AP4-R1]QJU59784.1 YqgE/AlgH family protein [Sphingomonas sp. AP4-R1]
MAHSEPDTPSLAGQLLLAMPGIGDPRFSHAVIALCVHSPEGALGIGVGQIVPRLSLHQLLGQLDIEPGVAPDAPIHLGGPVDPQRGFVLHSNDWAGEDTVIVNAALGLTSTLDVLRAIAAGEGPERWLVALGYAGWADGQLDGELTRHGWFHTALDPDLLFQVPASDRWPRGFATAGIDVRLLASTAGHA